MKIFYVIKFYINVNSNSNDSNNIIIFRLYIYIFLAEIEIGFFMLWLEMLLFDFMINDFFILSIFYEISFKYVWKVVILIISFKFSLYNLKEIYFIIKIWKWGFYKIFNILNIEVNVKKKYISKI